jgi:hypothetical protein
MDGRLATLMAILGLVLVACTAEAPPTISEAASPSPSQGSSPPPTVTPTATPSATTATTPTPATDATATPRALGPDMLAVVVTDDLVIRSEPGVSKESYVYKPYLGRREQLYVVDGPVRASGYDWYEVMPISARFEDTGWVAAASKKGKAWIKPLAAAPACPALPTTVTELDRLTSGVRLACFSGVPITVRAQLEGCGVDMPDAMYVPEMFNGFYDPAAEDLVPVILGEPGTDPCEMERQLQLAIDPATISPDQVPVGDVAELTGIFDHPAAADCEFVSFLVDESRAEPAWCRPKFVVTQIE